MKSKKGAEWMKSGAAPFEEYGKRQEQKFDEFKEQYDSDVKDTHEILADIIDLITLSEKEKVEAGSLLKEKLKAKQKLVKFKIKVIWKDSADKEMAENIRETFLKNEHVASVFSESEAKKDTQITDYVIYIGNDFEKMLSNNVVVLYDDSFGCIIKKSGSNILLSYDKKVKIDSRREQFISYYETVVKGSIDENKKVKKAIEKRRKQKPGEQKVYKGILNNLQKVMDAEDGISNSVISLLLMIGTFPAVVMSAIMALPVGIGEVLVESTVEGLRNASFDNAFVVKAQQQILQVKICEHIVNEQLNCLK